VGFALMGAPRRIAWFGCFGELTDDMPQNATCPQAYDQSRIEIAERAEQGAIRDWQI